MSAPKSRKFALEYQRSQVQTARPTQLVVMLYDGAIRFLNVAREELGSGDLEARHKNLLRAQRVIGELISSLNSEKGGEVAANLQRVYTFMLQQLVEANLHDKVEPIDHVIDLLRDLRRSWQEVDNKMSPVTSAVKKHAA